MNHPTKSPKKVKIPSSELASLIIGLKCAEVNVFFLLMHSSQSSCAGAFDGGFDMFSTGLF